MFTGGSGILDFEKPSHGHLSEGEGGLSFLRPEALNFESMPDFFTGDLALQSQRLHVSHV